MDILLSLLGQSTGDMTAKILWSPNISTIWLWGGFGLLLILCTYGFFQKIRGSALRLTLGIALLLTLSNPVLIQSKQEKQPDVALLLIDNSSSQKIGDRSNQITTAIKQIQDKFSSHFIDTEFRTLFLSDLNPTDIAKGRSHLLEFIEKATADIPLSRYAGSFLITDGQGHDLPATTDVIVSDHAYTQRPIHVLLTGSEKEIDRQIELVNAPSYGLVGEEVEISYRIIEQNSSGGTAQIRIDTDGGVPIRRQIPVGSLQTFRTTLDKRGLKTIAITVEELPDEISKSNNQLAVSINAVRDRLKVLLVSGVPHPGERTWRNLLKSDPSVDLIHFTILRPPEKQDDTPVQELSLIAFPTRELFHTKLNEFDLVVFDRYRRRGVLPSIYLRNITKYVENGGALLEIGGPGYASPYSLYRTALGQILPGVPTGEIYNQPFKPALSETGLRHPVTARLPKGQLVSLEDDIRWGRWLRQIGVQQRDGETLLEGIENHPLLTLNRVGEGRLAQLYSDQIWLWARGYEGGGPYAELIRRLAHWLMKEPELEENDLKAFIEGNNLHVAMRSLTPPKKAEVTVTGPAEISFTLPLNDLGNGRYEASKQLDIIGLYKVNNHEQSILATQEDGLAQEWQALVATAEKIRPLTETIKGSITYLNQGLPHIQFVEPNGKTSGPGWVGFVENKNYRVTGVNYRDILPNWLGIILLSSLVLLGWKRETK